MPWVIWDILVPMLATFAIGLAAGWLLWRWRRQKVDVATPHLQNASASTQLDTDDSGNVVLIKERDDAVARADTAEAELDTLKSQIDLSVMGIDDSQVATMGAAADQQVSEEANAEIESLTRQLEKERASKAEVERSLVDINALYKDKSILMDQEVSTETADSLKDVATLESNLKQAKETIDVQQMKIKQLEEHEQTSKQKFEQEIAVKEALLKQERADREEARMELAREKLTNEQAVAALASAHRTPDVPETTKPEDSAESNQSNKVHRLPVNAAASGIQSITSKVASSDELSQPGADDVSSDGSSGQAQNGSAQSAKSDITTGTAQSSRATIGQSAVAAGGASAQASVARAEPTPIPEGEDVVIDEVVEDAIVYEEKEVEEEQDQAKAEELEEASSASKDAGIVATQQNVTSINAAPRKPVVTDQINDTQDVNQLAVDSQAKVEASASKQYLPVGWEVPEEAPSETERDKLQDIKGIGPVLEKTLHETGIYHFRQIALLDATGVQELDDQLSQFSGRILREKWVEQANTLHQSKYGSAAQ